MIQLKKLVEAINNAAEIANATLVNSHDQVIDNFFNKDGETGKYQAKIIVIEYPIVADGGTIEKRLVEVPLITVVPISSARIEGLKFTTELEIALENNDLMVSFTNSNREGFLSRGKKKSTFATLEIDIRPQENTEGLNKLIEGFEKQLRAQIPG
ncbi:DUF2589 domain-containing protein [Fluviicola taffensis]|uniref:DUF2589 domain-containing protein n=1 Tax=Fluviicola taffensis TaxID=191579 RepID=UPI0031382364